MATEAQKRSKKKWDRENVTQVKFDLYPNDQDIIDHINKRVAIEGKAAYFRRLVREDIEKEDLLREEIQKNEHF